MIDKMKLLQNTLRQREMYIDWANEENREEESKERYKIEAEEQEYIAKLIMKDIR